MVFRLKTAQQTKSKICSATFKHCAGSTSSMSAHLKRQLSIDFKVRSVGLKDGSNSTAYEHSTGTGQLKIQDVMKNKLHGQATGQR